MTVNVSYTPEFKRSLRILSKKYSHIRDDIEPLIHALQNGELLGDQVPGISFAIFKARLPNRDAKKGKSGGYRVIYYLQTRSDIILITIYSKTEQSDISSVKIRQIVNELEIRK